jgi:hypothetical protein
MIRLLLVLAALIILIAVVQSAVLSYVIREAVIRGGAWAGLEVVAVDVHASLGRPVVLSNLEIAGRGANETALHVGEITVAPSGFGEILRNQDRLIHRLAARDVRGIFDARHFVAEPGQPSPSLSREQTAARLAGILRFLPVRLSLQTGDFQVLLEDLRISTPQLSLELVEDQSGTLSWDALSVETPDWTLEMPPSNATTAWKNGALYLADWALLPVLYINSCSLEIFRPGAVTLDWNAASLGGWIRGNARLNSVVGAPPLEFTLWAGQLDVSQAAGFFAADSLSDAEGLVSSLRVGFRGDPQNLPASDTTIRLLASNVSWQKRGWEDLVVGLRLADGRFTLSEFLLQQEENRIEAVGELLWPRDDDFSNLEALEGKLESTAKIENLSSLAALAGDPFGNLSGQLEVKTDLRWSRGEASGTMDLTGEGWTWRDQQIGGASIRATLEAGEMQIRELSWKNGGDFLDLTGSFRFSEPFVYSGKATLGIAEAAPYAALLDWKNAEGIRGGIRLAWQGDGTASSHSGAWDLSLETMIIPKLTEGITGNFRGSYSPDNLFSACRITHDQLELTFSLAAGTGGVYADKIFLRSGKTALLDGSIYLPWNPLVLLTGSEWPAGLLGEKNIYADLRTRRLELRDVGLILGRELPVNAEFTGQVGASGPLEAPEIDAQLAFGKVTSTPDSTQILESGQIKLAARNARATVEGTLALPKVESVSMDPVILQAAFPFGIAVRENRLVWTDPTGDLEGKITLPDVDLSRFAFLAPDIRRVQGLLSGEILLGRSLSNPSIEGTVTLREGLLEVNRQTPELTNLRMTLRFDGDSFRLEDTGGEIGAGPFLITGGASWKNPASPDLQLNFEGNELLLYRDRAMRIRADANLSLVGNTQGGAISGSILLVDGRMYQRLEITPLLQGGGPDTGAPLLLPDLAGLVPPPLGNWTLDISVENKTPFMLVGNLASGTIEPAIRVVGNLGDPRPSGRMVLRDLKAFLPFATVTIPEGIVSFDENSPRSPNLDIRGFSQVLEYDIQLFIQGALEERNLILRSDPPLSQEQILLLLTAGIAPGASSGPGAGQAIAGQGSLLVLKALLRNFEPDGVDLDSLINRVQIVSAPPPLPGLRSTLRGEFRLTENASIYSERDGLGYLGGGVTYRIRFR